MKRSERVKEIPLAKITVPETQPRRYFDEDKLETLAENVRSNGVLQPVTVVKRNRGYILVAGERRCRAAKRAGLLTVPAIIAKADDRQIAALSLLENLHREDLNCFEQAKAMRELLSSGMTRQELGRRLSLSQPAIANKLRTLVLAEDQQKFAVENGLCERQVRAIIRLSEEKWDTALWDAARLNQSAAATEQMVERMLGDEKPTPRCHPVVKDVRIFFNTITKAVEVMNRSGVGATAIRRDTDGFIEYLIRIPAPAKQPAEKA